MEIEYGATGFMAVHRDVVTALIKTMPALHPQKPWGFWPLFELEWMDYELLSEDWAFCSRAKAAGFKTYVDPSIRLVHMGEKGYTIEDVLRPNVLADMRAEMRAANEALLGEAPGTAMKHLKAAMHRSKGLDGPIDEAGVTEKYRVGRMESEWGNYAKEHQPAW